MRFKIISLILVGVIVLGSFFMCNIAANARTFKVGTLTTRLPEKAGDLKEFEVGDWQIISEENNGLLLKIMSLEPVVRRSEFITHELIELRYHQEKDSGSGDNKSTSEKEHHLPVSAQFMNIVGIMMQEFVQKGFEIGEDSSFLEINGKEAYNFELIRGEISSEGWLKGRSVKYMSHIILPYRDGWYLFTYCNFDDSSPGPHFSDFKVLLENIRFQ